MSEGYIEDDGGLSSDFIFVNWVPSGIDLAPEALWIGVRRGFLGDRQMEEPTVWIQYQEEYMKGPLTGAIALSPEQWRELNLGVEWRLRIHESREEAMPPDESIGPET